MLVLTRKPNQQLHIGNDIVITVVKIRGNTIRLGIEAPRDVRVVRSELDEKSVAVPLHETLPSADSSASAEITLSLELDSDSEPCLDNVAANEGSAEETAVKPSAVASDSASDSVSMPTANRSRSAVRPTNAKRAPLAIMNASRRTTRLIPDRNVEDSPLCHRGPVNAKGISLSETAQTALGQRARMLNCDSRAKNLQAKNSTSGPKLVAHS